MAATFHRTTTEIEEISMISVVQPRGDFYIIFIEDILAIVSLDVYNIDDVSSSFHWIAWWLVHLGAN